MMIKGGIRIGGLNVKRDAISPLLTGLLAYWNLDNNSWLDSSGNGRTLSNPDAVGNLVGIINYGGDFSGNKLSCSSFVNGLPAFSTSCWVYKQSGNGPWEADSDRILSSWGDGGNAFILTYQDGGGFGPGMNVLISTENGLVRLNVNSELSNDTWYHFVFTYDGSTMKLYQNASLIGSESADGNIISTTDPFAIGGDYYYGKIDEVGAWNRALTGAEITSLYNAGAGKTYPFA